MLNSKECRVCKKPFIPNSNIQKDCNICKNKGKDSECPICNTMVKSIGLHFSRVRNKKHFAYMEQVKDYIRQLAVVKKYYSKEIKELVALKFGVGFTAVVTKVLKLEFPNYKKDIFSVLRTGENNPVHKQGVAEKISTTLVKKWDEGGYNKRINGMLGMKGELSKNYIPEQHTNLYLAEHKYRDFLGQYEDISICTRCGGPAVNIHHIDENRNNFLPSNLEPLCVPCHSVYHYKIHKLPFVTVGKKFTFAAAHYLPHYDGPCFNLHGHEWSLIVSIKKRIDPKTGMVLDFNILKQLVSDFVIKEFDHSCINDRIKNPTAENMLVRIWEILMFDAHLKGVESIELWETPSSKAELTKEGMLSVLSKNIESYIKEDLK